jgi:hypothetical protein
VLVRNKQGEGERHRERSLCRRVRANHTDRGFKKSGVADEEATSVKCGTTDMLKIKFSLGDARRCRCGIFGISYTLNKKGFIENPTKKVSGRSETQKNSGNRSGNLFRVSEDKKRVSEQFGNP